MDQSIVILGRQPALGVAELESLYGAAAVTPIGDFAAQLTIAPCSIDFDRLGGAIKLCKMLTVLDTTNWKAIEKFIVQAAPGHSQSMPEGKMHLGLSVYGMQVDTKQLLASGLTVKKAIQRTGRSVRLVPNKSSDLNAAQVLHNKLTTPNGWELVFVRDGNDKTIVAQTVAIQDIDSYSQRDFDRPKRDTRVGMLPPKLAQIIINLAIGSEEFSAIKGQLSNDMICMPKEDVDKMHAERANTTVLDPFCGTGVVLQEALLMGYQAYGTDLEQRMVDYSQKNLEWLAEHFDTPNTYRLEVGDATTHQWQPPVNVVACETYLGRPFTSTPSPEILAQTVSDCNLIIKKFLQNIHQQLQAGARLCLAVPAWQVKPGTFKHLALVDQLQELGYNQVRFEHVRDEDLLYYRPDQIVARELLVITRN